MSNYSLTIEDKENTFFVHDLVEQIAKQYADHTAVVFGEISVTYKELNDRATKISAQILKQISSQTIVGISTSRNIDMVAGVLGILKAGKAYLPLDPSYPAERIKQIIEGSGIQYCIAPQKDEALFSDAGLTIIKQTDEVVTNAKADIPSLAYVLYTSGSTGKPKGVAMGHAALVNLLQWQKGKSIAAVGTKTLQFAPLSFDVSFQEIFATLSTGGTLVLIEEQMRLDPLQVLSVIEKNQVSRIFLPFVALQYMAEMATSFKIFPSCLTEIITAGEQLKITPQIISMIKELPGCKIYNQYGPTECHVVTELQLSGDPSAWPLLPTIGTPIDNVEIFIVGEDMKPLPAGEMGELIIAGVCLAEGYLNRPDLTADKFVDWEHPTKGKIEIYRAGDLARYLPNGEIEFNGRIDGQVKIRGNRIELGEIEAVLAQHEQVKQIAVVAREDVPGQKYLMGYYISNDGEISAMALKGFVANALPDYMVPSHFMMMKSFPSTTSGKIDRKALPKPEFKRPELLSVYKKPSSAIEKNIAEVWSTVLTIEKIGTADNFFELGGNSLLAQKTVANLKSRFNYNLPITRLYQFPTIEGIAKFLQQEKTGAVKLPLAQQAAASADVAIIGMAGRFPGANTIEQFWDVVSGGKETVSFFTKEELDASIPDAVKNDPDYVRARGIIENADKFDAAFFDLNPKLAELMDPQQRVFLEIAWELLEKTGYVPQKYDGSIAVYAGTGTNSYYYNNVFSNPKKIEQVGSFQVMTANEKDYVASRTAYQLNLKGPAVSVYSACSTSLLAISQAVESIRKGQTDIAIAGGVSITSPINSGHVYQEGAMLSKDGHCRSFDADATGTTFSDGAGVILLKSLEAAIKDGDTIYSVIKGIGVNNDGGGKGSFTAPNSEGQAGAIAMAIRDAGVDASTIGYVEAHGTATPLGDPIEIEGLKMAFGEQATNQYCAIGSVKSNMGHLTAAAGVAGLIKATLSLYNRKLLPSLGFDKPNPNIDFANSPFYVNTKFTDWQTDKVRRAGISSFGVGGTNVHVVLEEYANEPIVSSSSRPVQLLTWSAKSGDSLDRFSGKLQDHLKAGKAVNLADAAYTLQLNRASFMHRRFAVAASGEELTELLLKEPSSTETKILKETPAGLVFMFPGQGSQYLNMGVELYRNELVYREAIDECAAILLPLLQTDIRNLIFPEKITTEAEATLKNTRYTQPAIFITEYALGKLWMSWGIEPSVLCGHSIGEFVAATFAGIFELPDALKLIATRGRMVSELPEGSMLSVRMPAQELKEILPGNVSIAAVNSDKLCVVAGEHQHIAAYAQLLEEKKVPNKLLHTSHAFHSAMMDPIVDVFEKVVSEVNMSHPRKAIVSTVTGDWMTDAQATDAKYWAKHLRATVVFADAVETIIKEDTNVLFVEVGPGNALSTLVAQQAGAKGIKPMSSLERSSTEKSEYRTILKTLGQLWLNGIEPGWKQVYNGQQRVKINLPAYAFDKKYCWVPIVKQQEPGQLQPVEQLPVQETSEKIIVMRKDNLIKRVKEILEDASGVDVANVSPDETFLEMGLDSLLLTQVAITLKKEFSLPLTFRQLNEEYSTLGSLAQYLDEQLPQELFRPAQVQQSMPAAAPQQQVVNNMPAPSYTHTPIVSTGNDTGLDLIAQQLQILAKQVALMKGFSPAEPAFVPAPQPVAQPVSSPTPVKAASNNASGDLTPEEAIEIKKPFGATARIDKHVTELDDQQKNFLQKLTETYNAKTKSSKAYAQENRAHMSDPRVVSGFKPLTKEIVYPLVVNKSQGSHLWDVDGNEYIDALNGFGSSIFGHQPGFIKTALHEQIEKGYEVGPQHDLAGEVSKLICELTGADRAALCSTGSEAVLGTIRIARTVTGRSLIVAFTGSYHGINDEVLVRGTKKLKSFPAAPGIMPESVQNMLILDYGTEESLKIIRERAHELAAVLVEPIQSRRPEFRPVEFLKQVREITLASGTALIFDEVITGFRMHPAGAQGLFGIKADIASYGKVIGGGLPIGAIAGKKAFMDALDGGFWKYGDASYPEVGVTYFAGTFVRHPLALASAQASLKYMKEKGPEFQRQQNAKGDKIAEVLNSEFEKRKLPFFIAQFGSLWKIKFHEEVPYGELLFTLMRLKGIHIWDGFPCFTTEAHTSEEIDRIISLFIESADELIQAGYFKGAVAQAVQNKQEEANGSAFNTPPVPGAKLGRDKNGNPAWYISDESRPGNFIQVNLNN